MASPPVPKHDASLSATSLGHVMTFPDQTHVRCQPGLGKDAQKTWRIDRSIDRTADGGRLTTRGRTDTTPSEDLGILGSPILSTDMHCSNSNVRHPPPQMAYHAFAPHQPDGRRPTIRVYLTQHVSRGKADSTIGQVPSRYKISWEQERGTRSSTTQKLKSLAALNHRRGHVEHSHPDEAFVQDHHSKPEKEEPEAQTRGGGARGINQMRRSLRHRPKEEEEKETKA
ncbi:hypothetical protein B296_00054198 [Ensete ventricosum]|uniref:Uncharacterized protein n=1 Tax=Ensete ventricosum TaxID=4639 RepID=A0A426Y4W6_ENSVE|nr:hypothetical protein B296_00054198 [Ensete ventricosum]